IGDQNEVTDNAAQLLHLTASVTLDRLRIQNAYADQDGAAIYIAGSDTTTVILQDCRIADNETTANGGGIAVVSGNARIEHCYFQNNRAGVFGGAYYRAAQADTRIRNTFWMDNQAMSGGAIYQVGSFDNTIDLPIVNSIFARNIATDNGGAIYNAAASTTLINCTVTDNQAMAGAAIYNVSASDLTQININTIFSNHRAGEAFVFGLQARGRFDHCLLSDNSSCPQGAECELVIFDELPLFGESQPDEYRPLPCSPIQNNAATAFAPQQDIFNTPRMQTDSLADIGAVEINMTQSGIPAIVTGSTVDGCSPNSTGRISIEPSPDWSFPVQIIINADTTVAMQSDIITIDSLLAADYMFDVVDAVGCSYSYETTVDSVVNDIFIIVDVLNGISCFDACDALINVVASGSTDYTFDWSDGERGQQRSICAGDYELTVTDANGCVLVRPVTIEQPSMPLTVETTVTNTTDSESADGSISVVVTGGTPDYTFAWSDGTVDTTELTNLPSGDYELTVTDANGCTFTTLVVVGATTVALELNSINVTAPVCAGDSTGQIVVDVSGGVGEISFDWTPATADTNVLDGLGAGLYGLTISDEMGPQIDTIIEVVAPEAIRILNSDVLHPTCVNRCDGEILLELEAGEPPFSISWSVDDPTAPLDELCAGDYVITVTDNKGCSAVSDTITLSAPDSIFIELVIEDDNGTANGAIFANVEGGSPGYAFQWTDEAGNALDETGTFISNLLAGVYCLVVTDFNGCVDSRCATVGLNTSTTDLTLPSAWQLFPIPAQTEVEVYVDFALKDDWKWQLLDINGQILKTAAITQTVFSVSTEQLAAGMYYMRLQSAEASTIKPLIVMP
ncbi:MAG: T9SS type A sorting domain-containing protein, partial [Bacteroidota bacterium]